MKGGFDYQKFDYANTFYRYQNGAFQFGSYRTANRWLSGTVATGDTLVYQGSFSDFGGTIAFGGKQTGLYVQSQYQGLLNRRLTLNLGVRYNREEWDPNPRPNPVFQGLDQAPSSNGSVDPRFGFTFDVFGNNRTVVRGGYGEFSAFNPALTVSNTENSNGNTTSTFRIANSSANNALFNSGLLSYGSRVTNGGTVLTALPQSVLRDPGSYGLTLNASKQGQIWDPDNKLTKKKLSALGVEHDLGHGFVAGIRAEYAEFEHLQSFVNVNLVQQGGGTWNDGYPTTVNKFSGSTRATSFKVRGREIFATAAGFNDVFMSSNNGSGTYEALILTLNRRVERGWGFTSSLTWAKTLDNNSNERTTASGTSDSNNNNPANLQANLAPSDNDRRFRGVFAGYFPLYFGIQGSAVLTYTTGKPYSAIAQNMGSGPTFVSGDINSDGSTNDYVPGTSRNQFRQPHVKTFDLRFTRNFQITRKFSLEGQIDIFNALNWANWATSLTRGNADGTFTDRTATFGYLNLADRRTREVQFGLRARF